MKKPALTYAERSARYRASARSRGEPLVPDLDRSIRNAVLTAYRTGQHTLDVTDLVATVVDGMIASDPTVTRRGCFGLLNRLNRVARP